MLRSLLRERKVRLRLNEYDDDIQEILTWRPSQNIPSAGESMVIRCIHTRFFFKKLGSGHCTKSFLISHSILSILVPKVS